MNNRHRSIAFASVVVPLAAGIALWALLSQLAFFGERPTHQGRAILLLGIAAALVVIALGALARNGTGVLRRAAEAVAAAVLGGYLVALIALPALDDYVVPVVFGVGCGASVALPRRTPARLAARLAAVAAMLALVGWATRDDPERLIAVSILLALPSVVAGDAAASRWARSRGG